MKKIKIRCFGLLSITLQGLPLTDLEHSPALRDFLGYLILQRNKTLSRSQVAGRFWPDVPEAQARRNLNNLLWRLRQLGSGALAAGLHTNRDTLRWELPEGSWLDLAEFERQTTLVASLPAETSSSHSQLMVIDQSLLPSLAQAESLYRGEMLAGCAADWCEQPRLRYQERYCQLLQLLITSYEQQKMPEAALPYAHKLLLAEPYLEWAHEALVRLHLASSQPQAALLAYQEYNRCWQQELGLSPSAPMNKLFRTMTVSDDPFTAADSWPVTLAQLNQMVTKATASPTLAEVAQSAISNLCCAALTEAERIGQTAEAEYAWEVAQQAYQAGLAVLENLPDAPNFLQRQFDFRLRCDTLYDRTAQRQAQACNLNQALNIAQKLNDRAKQSEICARHCWVATGEGKLQQAVHWGERALKYAGGDQTKRAQALRLLGTCHELQGAYAQALTRHQEALTLDTDQPEPLIFDHNNLASVCLSLGEDWLAWQHIQTAVSLIPKKPPSLVQAVVLGNLAHIARELGDFATASTHLLRAQKVAGMMGSRENEIRLATRAATLYRQTGQIARASQWASYAWQQSQILRHPRCAMEAALENIRLAHLAGNHSATKLWLQQVVHLLETSELERYRGIVELLQALAFLQNNDLKKANEAAQEGLELVQAANEYRYLSLAHFLLSLIARQQLNKKEAKKQLIVANQLLHQRANKIPNSAARERFLQATPLRSRLAVEKQPSLSELMQFS